MKREQPTIIMKETINEMMVSKIRIKRIIKRTKEKLYNRSS
jgi:hypothetical protein